MLFWVSLEMYLCGVGCWVFFLPPSIILSILFHVYCFIHHFKDEVSSVCRYDDVWIQTPVGGISVVRCQPSYYKNIADRCLYPHVITSMYLLWHNGFGFRIPLDSEYPSLQVRMFNYIWIEKNLEYKLCMNNYGCLTIGSLLRQQSTWRDSASHTTETRY